MAERPLKLLILGAHPDDAEYAAGGIAALYRAAGHTVKMVSLTDGGAGHHWRTSADLVKVRRAEAAEAGKVIGAEYVTWDFPDGRLEPSLALRERVIRELRTFQPDLVLAHRTNDYHPDHRAAGQVVQDASYMVTVPLVVPDVPILRKDPVVACLPDLFTRPCPLRPDVVLDLEPHLESIVRMLACHCSQVFEFLPYNEGIDDQVPAAEGDKLPWLRAWFSRHIAPRADRFREALIAAWGQERGRAARHIEAFEISEYAARLDDAARRRLFWWTN
jgi:LmbE family N-acetylglucosaminyl deacetylase